MLFGVSQEHPQHLLDRVLATLHQINALGFTGDDQPRRQDDRLGADAGVELPDVIL